MFLPDGQKNNRKQLQQREKYVCLHHDTWSQMTRPQCIVIVNVQLGTQWDPQRTNCQSLFLLIKMMVKKVQQLIAIHQPLHLSANSEGWHSLLLVFGKKLMCILQFLLSM